MEIVMLLVPIMLVLVTMGIFLFSWAVKNGQYDDLDGPAHRILYDDDQDMIPEEARTDKSEQPKSPSESESEPEKQGDPENTSDRL